MKNLIIILVCILVPMIFVSCSVQTASDDNDISKSPSEILTEDNTITEKATNKEPYNDDSNIEKVIISYLGQKSESTYDEDAHVFLNEIKNCQDKPEAIMVDKIGEILIKYKNSGESISIATLYIGSDNNVYAKYTTEDQNNYAYKIDIEKLNH